MKFDNAPIKGEGQPVDYGHPEGHVPPKPKVEITWIERRIPEHLEFRAHRLLDTLLVENGYNPREI